MNGGTVGIEPQRFTSQVDVDSSGDGVSDDQHGGCQVVGLHLRVHSSLEVAIATQDCHCNQVTIVNRSSYIRR